MRTFWAGFFNEFPIHDTEMKRRDLLRGGSLVLCLGATDLVFGASIVAVRIWPDRKSVV